MASGGITLPVLQIESGYHPFRRELRFGRDSAEPLADTVHAIDEVAHAMQAIPSVEVLGVVGHVEAGEDPELSERRAERVIDLLVLRGAPRQHLRVAPRTALPPEHPIGGQCGNVTAAELAADRRMELAKERWVRFVVVAVADP